MSSHSTFKFCSKLMIFTTRNFAHILYILQHYGPPTTFPTSYQPSTPSTCQRRTLPTSHIFKHDPTTQPTCHQTTHSTFVQNSRISQLSTLPASHMSYTIMATNNFSDISSVINAFNAFNLPTNNCTDISHFQALSNNSTDMSSHNAFNFCSNRRISELRTLPTSHISYNIMVHQQLFRDPIPSTSSTCPQHYGRPTTSPASHHSQIYIQLDQHCPTTFPTSRFANTFKLADVSHILQHYDPSMIQQLFQHLIFEQLPESPSACQQARLHSINATTL